MTPATFRDAHQLEFQEFVMSNEHIVTRRQRRTLRKNASVKVPSYHVTLTDVGKWLSAPGSDFLFAYLESDWPASVQAAVTSAFEAALKMSTVIKASVKENCGQDVVNGLYLLDQPSMTKAMNAIDGMGQTSVNQNAEDGSGTAASITGDFFAAILGGLGGDVAPLLTYLTTQMGDIQAQVKQDTVTNNFGTVIGLISVMPVLNVPVTTFVYAYSSQTTSTWFVTVNCGSAEQESYDYAYTTVEYNYSP
jgi:hypothetical protein